MVARMSPPRGRLPTVNQVDVMEARRPPGPVTHAPYRREPYVRAQLDDGRTIDTKAAAWSRTHVLLHWVDGDGKVRNVWVLASKVKRIRARKVPGVTFTTWSGETDDIFVSVP